MGSFFLCFCLCLRLCRGISHLLRICNAYALVRTSLNICLLNGCPKTTRLIPWSYNWVHTSLVSRPQVYFNLTSDMNGSNFNLSSLLCSRGNVSCSKEPKYTSKSSSTHPYRRTYALSKQFQEIECQSNALFDEISEHTRLVRHARHFRTTCLLDAWLSRTWKCFFQRKFSAGQQTTEPVSWTWPKPSSSSSTLRVLF